MTLVKSLASVKRKRRKKALFSSHSVEKQQHQLLPLKHSQPNFLLSLLFFFFSISYSSTMGRRSGNLQRGFPPPRSHNPPSILACSSPPHLPPLPQIRRFFSPSLQHFFLKSVPKSELCSKFQNRNWSHGAGSESELEPKPKPRPKPAAINGTEAGTCRFCTKPELFASLDGTYGLQV